MKKQKKSGKNLPSWFNLRKYDFVNALADEDLIKELEIRWVIHNSILNTNLKDPEIMDWFEKSFIGAAWQDITKFGRIGDNPLAERFYPVKGKTSKNTLYSESVQKTIFEGEMVVRPISIWECISEGKRLEKMHNFKYRADGSAEVDVIESEYGVFTGASSVAACERGFAELNREMQISINLSFDDNQIMDSISALLPMWREQKKKLGVYGQTPDKPTKTTLQKIRDLKVLPYIDLMIWSGLKDSKIRNRHIEIALYPDGCDDLSERHIGTVLRRHYRKVMTGSFLASLSLQVESGMK